MNITARLAPSIHTYAELQKQLHNDLLDQHPEWIQPDGNCPMCEDYDRRFAELISFFQMENSTVQAA